MINNRLHNESIFCVGPINCEWSAWSWGACSVTCGGGTQSGSRTISQQAANGGTECTGETTTTQPCNTESCQGS